MSEHLPVGALVDGGGSRFEILSTHLGEDFLSADAYTISYLTYDEQRDQLVELREYFRAGIARRDGMRVLPPINLDNRPHFEGGKEHFLNNCASNTQKLNCFEANGTAFMVMPIDFKSKGSAVEFATILEAARVRKEERKIAAIPVKAPNHLAIISSIALVFGGGTMGLLYARDGAAIHSTPIEAVNDQVQAQGADAAQAEEAKLAEEKAAADAKAAEEAKLAEEKAAADAKAAEEGSQELSATASQADELAALKAANEIYLNTASEAPQSNTTEVAISENIDSCLIPTSKFEAREVLKQNPSLFGALPPIKSEKLAAGLVAGEDAGELVEDVWGGISRTEDIKKKAVSALCLVFPGNCDTESQCE